MPRAFEDPPESADIEVVSLTRDGETVRATRVAEDSWVLTAPESSPADSASVDRLVRAMLNLRFDDVGGLIRLWI